MRSLLLVVLVAAAPAWAQTELSTRPTAFSIGGATAIGIPTSGDDALATFGIDLEGSTKRLVATGSVFAARFDQRDGSGFGVSLGTILGDGRGGDAFTTFSGVFSQFALDGRITRVAGATAVHTRRIGRSATLDFGVQAGAGLAAPITTDGGTNEPQASATVGVLLMTRTGPTRFVARPSVGISATPESDSGVVTVGLQLGALFGPSN